MSTGHAYCTTYHYKMLLYVHRYFTCIYWYRSSLTPSSFLSNDTRYSCFILMWCLFSTLSIVEMLTDWMFWKTLLSSIMALCIYLSLMALFALQIASSSWGVKRDPLPPLWCNFAVVWGKNFINANTRFQTNAAFERVYSHNHRWWLTLTHQSGWRFSIEMLFSLTRMSRG